MSGKLHTKEYRWFLDQMISLRKEQGITQTVLAERLGTRQSWVSKYERGERRIDPLELVLIAKAIEVEPETILELAKAAVKS